MHVGFALLTLFPGRVGGSESNVRGLLGEFTAGNGPERVTVLANRHVTAAYEPGGPVGCTWYAPTARAKATATRALAMATALAAPGMAARDVPSGLDLVHYPVTVPIPRDSTLPSVVTLLDVQHHDLPGFFSRGEAAFRRLAYDRAARARRRGGHDQRVLARAGSSTRWASTRSGSRWCRWGWTTRVSRPPAAATARPARAVPALPREPLAAQEPRAAGGGAGAHARRRAGAQRPALRPPGSRCSRARASSGWPGGCATSVTCPRDTLAALYRSASGADLPLPVRGIRRCRRWRRWRVAAPSPWRRRRRSRRSPEAPRSRSIPAPRARSRMPWSGSGTTRSCARGCGMRAWSAQEPSRGAPPPSATGQYMSALPQLLAPAARS